MNRLRFYHYSGEFSDISLTISDDFQRKTIRVHRIILAANSPFFASLFKYHRYDDIVIHIFDVDTAIAIITSFYGTSIRILNMTTLQKYHQCCDYLGIKCDINLEMLKDFVVYPKELNDYISLCVEVSNNCYPWKIGGTDLLRLFIQKMIDLEMDIRMMMSGPWCNYSVMLIISMDGMTKSWIFNNVNDVMTIKSSIKLSSENVKIYGLNHRLLSRSREISYDRSCLDKYIGLLNRNVIALYYEFIPPHQLLIVETYMFPGSRQFYRIYKGYCHHDIRTECRLIQWNKIDHQNH
jgi:hypothetical protein